MNQDYWQQQNDQPLFPNLIWSRPQTRHGAGKLLIIGGQANEFIDVAESYGAAEKAGAGTIRVIMPESTRKTTKMLPNIEYAGANTSGSFARSALAELLQAATWADAVLLSGNLGKNSETSLMLEAFVNNYTGLLVISNGALPSLSVPVAELINRNHTIIEMDRNSLQKTGIELKLQKPITSSMGDPELADILHSLTTTYPAGCLLINSKPAIWSSSNGDVALSQKTAPKSDPELAAQSAVWGMQNPSKLFEAVTTAAFC